MKLENMNPSPVACFRWLNVNDATVEIPFVPTGAAQAEPPQVLEQAGIRVSPYKGLLSLEKEKDTAEVISGLLESHVNQGFTLEILPGQKVQKPIEITFSATKECPSLLDVSEIVAGENSAATVVLLYKQEEEAYATARIGRLQIKAEAGSRLKVIKAVLLENSIETVTILQEAYSEAEVVSVDFATKNNVVNYRCVLEGEASANTLKTAYLGYGKDQLDFNFKVDLKGRRTKALMDTRGILTDSAQKIMKATLHFHQGAKQAKGAEAEYVMLISDEIKNSSVPLLLCDEDDVSGEHAAGIGRVDESTMFYLTSRGFTPKQAKNILVRGYLDPVLAELKDCSFAEQLEQEIGNRMVLE